MRTKPYQIAPAATDGHVLKTVGGETQWASGGSFNPGAGRSPWLAPYGVRIRGANIGAKQYGDTGDKPWGRMFGEWNTLWGSYIKPQIDAAASVGANAIRMMGAAPGVIEGLCTQDQYINGYERLVDYCATQGIWVYACLSASQEWFGRSVASVMPVMLAQATMLDSKPNVIGIDVCQEIGLTPGFISSSSTHDAASQLVAPVRAVTTLPLTCSVTVANNTTAGAAQFAATTVTDYNDLFDFFDYHPYYDYPSVSDVATAANAAAAVNKVILFGEYGATDSVYQRYDAVATITEGTANLVGSFAWQVADRLAMSTPYFGMFTNTFTPRSTLITAFQKIPDHFHAKHSGHHLHDEGVRLPARTRLDFIGAGVTAADDATNDTTTVTIPGPTLTVQDENSNVSTSVTQIDFQGGGVTASAGTGEVVVTIPTSSLVVKDEGSTLTSAAAQIDFVGTGVTAATSGANVTVTVPGASAGAGELLMQDGVTAPPVPIENEARDDWLYQG
jgi:hypothetical protein